MGYVQQWIFIVFIGWQNVLYGISKTYIWIQLAHAEYQT